MAAGDSWWPVWEGWQKAGKGVEGVRGTAPGVLPGYSRAQPSHQQSSKTLTRPHEIEAATSHAVHHLLITSDCVIAEHVTFCYDQWEHQRPQRC